MHTFWPSWHRPSGIAIGISWVPMQTLKTLTIPE